MKLVKFFLVLSVCILAAACQNKNNIELEKSDNSFDLPDSLSSRRVSLSLNLRSAVAELCLPEFAEKEKEGTLIYFNDGQAKALLPEITNNLLDLEEDNE